MAESQIKLKQINVQCYDITGSAGFEYFADIININKMVSLWWYNCGASRVSGIEGEGKFLLRFRR
jgi:hypothetical protein